MKAMIVCVSVHHGNTRKVADAIAAELGGRVVRPEGVGVRELAEHDLVAFGSGIVLPSGGPIDRAPGEA